MANSWGQNVIECAKEGVYLFFVRWIDDLVDRTRCDSARFHQSTDRDTVFGLYAQARRFYSAKAGQP
jgi:hypothetical protein